MLARNAFEARRPGALPLWHVWSLKWGATAARRLFCCHQSLNIFREYASTTALGLLGKRCYLGVRYRRKYV
jgi:hypothetical protein